MTLIEKARELGQCPEEIVIFGIEPELIDFGLDLTDTLSSHMDHYVAQVDEELKNTKQQSSRVNSSPGAQDKNADV